MLEKFQDQEETSLQLISLVNFQLCHGKLDKIIKDGFEQISNFLGGYGLEKTILLEIT